MSHSLAPNLHETRRLRRKVNPLPPVRAIPPFQPLQREPPRAPARPPSRPTPNAENQPFGSFPNTAISMKPTQPLLSGFVAMNRASFVPKEDPDSPPSSRRSPRAYRKPFVPERRRIPLSAPIRSASPVYPPTRRLHLLRGHPSSPAHASLHTHPALPKPSTIPPSRPDASSAGRQTPTRAPPPVFWKHNPPLLEESWRPDPPSSSSLPPSATPSPLPEEPRESPLQLFHPPRPEWRLARSSPFRPSVPPDRPTAPLRGSDHSPVRLSVSPRIRDSTAPPRQNPPSHFLAQTPAPAEAGKDVVTFS